MPQMTYTLSLILPYVRQSLGSGKLEYSTFVNGLWMHLEKANIPGVRRRDQIGVMNGMIFDWNSAPNDLKVATNEAFFYLVRNGYIVPQLRAQQYQNAPDTITYDITQRGREWAEGGEPTPEDIDGFMKVLGGLVPKVDPVIEQYVREGVRAFNEQLYFAAAVMLGAASEKALYLLGDDLLGALKTAARQQQLTKLTQGRSLKQLLEFIRDAIELGCRKNIPHPQSDGATTHLMSLLEAIRNQRNDAVHPKSGQVTPERLRLLIVSFPYALAKSEELREWLSTHPLSLD